MDDWTDGYVSEIGYTFGYYPDLNPRRIAVPFLNVGLMPPPIATACELGFGQGLSVNVHATASDVAWWGNDFNPGHTVFARSLAEAAGSGARLFDQSFAEFCDRDDLPDFDYIALHGVLSWVSPENQRIIVDFIRRKLKPGGVLYVSYNCQPGHGAMVPFRHLLSEHATRMMPQGPGIVARIDGAIAFAEALLALNPAFAVAHPTIAERLQTIKANDRHYLAHEYFNRDWHALPFSELAASLAAAKLTFAGSASYHDHIDVLNMTVEQQRFLAEIPDPIFRQTVRDFIVNQQFRRDYWVKGARRLSTVEQGERLRQLPVVLLTAPDDVALTVPTPLGRRELSAGLYQPLLDVLHDHAPHTLGEIEAAIAATGLGLPAIYEAIMVLGGRGDLAVVQDDAAIAHAATSAAQLNAHILAAARGGGALAVLASPVTGGGIGVSRFYQLFLLGRSRVHDGADALAQYAWGELAAQGQRMAKDGRPLETPEENIAELARQAREFTEKRLPILRALQLA